MLKSRNLLKKYHVWESVLRSFVETVNMTLWVICCWTGLALNFASSCMSLAWCLTLSYHISKTMVTLCTDKWNIQWCLGFCFTLAWFLQLILRRSPGGPACWTSSPLCRAWTLSVGSGLLGVIYNPTPSLLDRAHCPALPCQVLKERFLKMEQPYVPQAWALN